MAFRLLAIAFFVLPAFGPLAAQSATGTPDSCTCCSEPYRAFDFWIGQWQVTDSNGNVLGQNRIEQIQDGCSLQENWTGAVGNTSGTSLNYYVSSEGHWEQLWVDNGGNQLKLHGNREGNQMILASDPFEDSQGRTLVHRITWTAQDDGSVRQHWEVLQGVTPVQTLFDGIYRKM